MCENKTNELRKERIKVYNNDIEIIVGESVLYGNRPYYQIKYKEVGNNYYNVGLGSFYLENVIKWRKEEFEVVDEEIENKEAKTNVTNEELMQKIEGLEKELKRANSNIALALTTLTTVYAYEQAKLKQKVKEGTATNTEREINRLYKYADIAIGAAVKEQQSKCLKN